MLFRIILLSAAVLCGGMQSATAGRVSGDTEKPAVTMTCDFPQPETMKKFFKVALPAIDTGGETKAFGDALKEIADMETPDFAVILRSVFHAVLRAETGTEMNRYILLSYIMSNPDIMQVCRPAPW